MNARRGLRAGLALCALAGVLGAASPGPPVDEQPLKLIGDPIPIEMSETSLDGREQTDDRPEEIVYGLEASVLFAKDSAALTPDARATLKRLAQRIGRAHPTRPITVAGYTDNLGTAAHGLTLSKRRATAVAEVLEAAPALSDVTFRTRGYGESHPIASNKTESGREKNRRVTVTVPKA